MRMIRVPAAKLRGMPENRHFVIVVDKVVHLGDFLNKTSDGNIADVREGHCTVKMNDGSWLYIALPMSMVAAMLTDEACSYEGDY